MLQRDDRRALGRVTRAADRPALIQGAVDQPLRKELVPLAHLLDPDLREELEPGARRVDRGDRRCSVLESPRTRAVVQMLHIEREGLLHAPPADRARTRAFGDAPPGVEERNPRAAHEPLERAADEIVDAARVHIEGDGADGLVCVDDKDGALAVADLGEGAYVLDPASREVDVPGAHGGGALVDSAFEELERDAHTVGTPNELDARAAVRHREEGVTVRRKIEVGHDHFRPLGVVERARDTDQTRRHVGFDGDLVDRRAEHAREVRAKRFVLADPVVVPGASALVGPLRQEPLDPRPSAAVEGRQRAVVQIVEALGDRELRAPGRLVLFHHQPAT